MPKIIVQANRSDSDASRVTLSERVVATHLQDGHYATQLIERLAWAAIDAEELESPTVWPTQGRPDTRIGLDARRRVSPRRSRWNLGQFR